MRDLIQVFSHRDKAGSILTAELRSQSGGVAAASVVGTAASQTQQDLRAALFHRVADDLPHSVGRGLFDIATLPHHRQAGGAGHLHHCPMARTAVGGLRILPIGSGDLYGHWLSMDRFHKAIHRAFAPVGYRDGNYLTRRKKPGDGLLGNPADFQAGERSLE